MGFTTNRREIVDYSVILTVDDEDGAATVRVYDGAHGVNDMHRHDPRWREATRCWSVFLRPLALFFSCRATVPRVVWGSRC